MYNNVVIDMLIFQQSSGTTGLYVIKENTYIPSSNDTHAMQ